ncbi:hypothetical protein P262_02341 [Cronobacter malonaticus]|uniref:Uncharacterized protein n=1 Tax=Cronobacter malonaticus TaxID=413503 RepID=V5TZN7_9ENTR|nr:hypothetical protein P262_02341 [Cronobacter malonaticus]CCJ93024.1 hypothetical protein BN131_697 [Cronobacter malonaticus 681]
MRGVAVFLFYDVVTAFCCDFSRKLEKLVSSSILKRQGD